MNDAPVSITIPVRVRYVECDPMSVAHHSVYPIWLEMARTELLRQRGIIYKEIEAAGCSFAVVRMNIRYRRSAKYDDQLEIHCTMQPTGGVKIEHTYEIHRGKERIATAETTICCVDRDGKLQPVPEELRLPIE